MKKQVRVITQGAMMLAIIGLFLVLNLQTAGLLEVYMIWLMPLPIIFYVVRFGLKAGLVLAGAAIGLSFILGNYITLFYVLTAISIGLMYGYGVYKEKDNGWLLAMTTMITALSLFLEMYALAAFFGYDLARETRDIIALLKTVDGLIIPADIESLVFAVYPIALLLMAFLQSFITHVLSIFMLKRLKIKTRKMSAIETYRLPLWLGVISTIGMFSGVIMNFSGFENYRIPLVMLSTLSAVVFIVDAEIFIILYARMRKLKWLPLVSLLTLLILPMLTFYVFIGIGLMDCFTDLRQRMIQTLRG